jgi:hypothetical protein
MAYSIKLVKEVAPELMHELAGDERFVTHAHNPCVVDILSHTFGWEGGAFLVFDNDKPIGYFAGIIIKGHIVSIPHFSYGGLITSNPEKNEIYSEILPKLYEYFSGSVKTDISYLLRDTERVGAYVQDNKVVSWIDISGKSVQQVIPAAQFAKARKAIENGLDCKSGGIELLHDFYHVYSGNMLRLGSPVLPKQLFANILKRYTNGNAKIFCVYKEKAPVGASFVMSYMGFFENTWFSTLQKHNQLYPAQLLHQEMINFSISQGGRTYSFGRSTSGSGVHEFKRRWGTEETVIYWNYDKPLKTNLRKLEFLSKIWKLLPLPFANVIGPLVSGRVY